MILGRGFGHLEMVKNRLRQPCPISSSLIAVILRKSYKIVLLLRVKPQILNHRFQEPFPIDVTDCHREAGAGEDGRVLVVKLASVFPNEFGFLYRFSAHFKRGFRVVGGQNYYRRTGGKSNLNEERITGQVT